MNSHSGFFGVFLIFAILMTELCKSHISSNSFSRPTVNTVNGTMHNAAGLAPSIICSCATDTQMPVTVYFVHLQTAAHLYQNSLISYVCWQLIMLLGWQRRHERLAVTKHVPWRQRVACRWIINGLRRRHPQWLTESTYCDNGRLACLIIPLAAHYFPYSLFRDALQRADLDLKRRLCW